MTGDNNDKDDGLEKANDKPETPPRTTNDRREIAKNRYQRPRKK